MRSLRERERHRLHQLVVAAGESVVLLGVPLPCRRVFGLLDTFEQMLKLLETAEQAGVDEVWALGELAWIRAPVGARIDRGANAEAQHGQHEEGNDTAEAMSRSCGTLGLIHGRTCWVRDCGNTVRT